MVKFQCSEISLTSSESKQDETKLDNLDKLDNHILAISPSKLIIFGFYEVMKCYSETPPSMFFIICKWWKFNYFSDKDNYLHFLHYLFDRDS